MKTFYIICLLLACQSIITGLSAQTVSGKLVDEKNEPMPYANVVLLSLPDSAFVSGTISGDVCQRNNKRRRRNIQPECNSTTSDSTHFLYRIHHHIQTGESCRHGDCPTDSRHTPTR